MDEEIRDLQQIYCKVAGIATLHVRLTGFQDGGYTQLAQLQRDYLHWVKISFTHQ